MAEQEQIKWDDFEGARYVKITVGKLKTLTIDNGKQSVSDIKEKAEGGAETTKKVPCIVFHVTNEDGQQVDKEFSVTSRGLIQQLRPFVQKGYPFTVAISSYGEKFERKYEVKAA